MNHFYFKFKFGVFIILIETLFRMSNDINEPSTEISPPSDSRMKFDPNIIEQNLVDQEQSIEITVNGVTVWIKDRRIED